MSVAGFDSSIRRKLFFSHLLSAMLICLGFGGYYFVTAANALVAGIAPEVTQVAALVHTALDAPANAADLARRDDVWLEQRLRELVRRNPRIRALRLEIGAGEEARFIGGDGSLSAGSSHIDFSAGRVPSAFEIEGRLLGDGSSNVIRAWLPLPLSNDIALGVELGVGELGARMQTLRLSAALALLVALGFAVAISRMMAGRFLATINELNRRCQEMAGNENVQPLELDTADELHSLLQSFNTLAERLKRASSEREAALLNVTAANERLEQQVQERADELERLNHLLRGEVEHRLRAEAMIAEAAISDPLTNLLNRRGALEILQRALKRSRTRKQPISVAVADVDFFKLINDRYGHEQGDRVLVAVAQHMTASMKDEDIVARWGGEEFMLLWIDCPLAEGRKRAEALRWAISQLSFGVDQLTVTISIGITEARASDSLDSLLARADRALYHAKDSGRNLVVSTGEHPVSREQTASG